MGRVSKEHILAEIKRTAEENAGVALGRARFQEETGIRETDWSGRYWTRWSDAIVEAGYQPNAMQQPLPIEAVLESFVTLVGELGRFPTIADLKMRSQGDASFPSHNTFNRLGRRAERAARAIAYCEERGGLEHVIAVCAPIAALAAPVEQDHSAAESDAGEFGFVYLMKSGKYYKVGRSVCAEKRAYEVRLVLPEEVVLVHKIKTDDPAGIEAYWHHRFRNRRLRGEWFDLTAQDVKAFRRRKFM
ncbi:MAG: GIY-YIG nuclease family protein [Aeromicrobium sp.]|nr:GIY-YIG nuclease family protein [Aeromicrobium sp.]